MVKMDTESNEPNKALKLFWDACKKPRADRNLHQKIIEKYADALRRPIKLKVMDVNPLRIPEPPPAKIEKKRNKFRRSKLSRHEEQIFEKIIAPYRQEEVGQVA